MKVESIAESPTWSICNIFEMHKAKMGLETLFSIYLREAVLHRYFLYLRTEREICPKYMNIYHNLANIISIALYKCSVSNIYLLHYAL